MSVVTFFCILRLPTPLFQQFILLILHWCTLNVAPNYFSETINLHIFVTAHTNKIPCLIIFRNNLWHSENMFLKLLKQSILLILLFNERTKKKSNATTRLHYYKKGEAFVADIFISRFFDVYRKREGNCIELENRMTNKMR